MDGTQSFRTIITVFKFYFCKLEIDKFEKKQQQRYISCELANLQMSDFVSGNNDATESAGIFNDSNTVYLF